MAALNDLLIDIKALVGYLEDIAFGNDSTTVSYNGKTRSSVALEIKSKFLELQTMVGGHQAFETKAALDASGAPTPNADGHFPLSDVWNDNTEILNGIYGWDSSAWVKSQYSKETLQTMAEYLSSSDSGFMRPKQVSGSYSVTDWSTARSYLDWVVNGLGEIEMSASSVFSTSQIFKVGLEYRGGDASFEIETQVDTNTGANQNGCYLLIGSDSANYMEFLYANNGAVRIYDKASDISTSIVFPELIFALGESAVMRVEIEKSGRVTIVATSPAGVVRSHSAAMFAVPHGLVLAGWRQGGVGKIKSIRKIASAPKVIGRNEVANPDGRSGSFGWTVQNDGLALVGGRGFLEFTKNTGTSQFVSCEAKIPALVEEFSYHLDVIGMQGADLPAVRLLIIQYTDLGPGIISGGAEVARIEAPESAPVETGFIFKGVAKIHPDATRVVLAVGLSDVGTVLFKKACINFNDNSGEYIEPVAPSILEFDQQSQSLASLGQRLTGLEADTAILDAATSDRRAGIDCPSDFSFKDYGFNIYRSASTGTIISDFNPKSKIIPSSLSIYIDPVVGSDVNDGDIGSPLATLAAAFLKMNASLQGATIHAAPGLYYGDDVGDLSGFNITQHFNLVSTSETVPAVFIQGCLADSWTQDAEVSSLWYADMTGAAPLWLADGKNLDAYGEAIPLQPRNKADAGSIGGSCYVEGQRIYVNLADGRAPDSDCIVLQDLPSLYLRDRLFYLENIHFLGGSSSSGGVYTAHAAGDSCINQCRFSYAYNGNAFGVLRGRDGRMFSVRSTTSYSRKLDGFNYHKGSQSIASDVVEIECLGHHNGLQESGNNNGTTMHDGGRSIRINCDYSYNMNRNIHDISDGTESWLLGTAAGSSQTSSLDPYDNANFMFGRSGYVDTTKVWLDSCRSVGGSLTDFAVYPGAELRVRNTDVSNLKSNQVTGTLIAY